MPSRPARRHADPAPARRGVVAVASLLLVGGAIAVPVALTSSASAAAAWKHCPPGESQVLIFQKSGGTIQTVYADGVTPKSSDKATIVDKSTWTWSTPERTISSVLVDTGYGPNWVPKGPSSHGGTITTPGETIVALTLCGKDTSTTSAPPTSPTKPTKTPTTPPTTPTCEPSSPGGGSAAPSCSPTTPTGPPTTPTPPPCESSMPPSSPGGGSATPSCSPTTPTPPPTTPTPTITGGTTTPPPTTPTPTITGGTTTPSQSTSTPAGGGSSGGGSSSAWGGTTLPHTGSPSTGVLTGGLAALVAGAALLVLSAWRRPAPGAHRR